MTEQFRADLPVLSDGSITTRGYQQEMLEESLQRNIIIAMDTGSGKTHIAVLRMKIETEREPTKICWFMAPTRQLCEQQKAVIKKAIGVEVGLISGALEPEQWTDKALWRKVLDTYRIVVSTPQVLLDALHHAYVTLGVHIGLLIFDEAHHAVDKHPYNEIMRNFYFACPPRVHGISRTYGIENVRPIVLGLTASPVYGGNLVTAFRVIEHNLDCIIRSPRRERAELNAFVHRPVFKTVLYSADDTQFSTNLAAFQFVVDSLDIETDPYVLKLRKDLAKATRKTIEYDRLDQKLSKTIQTKNTYTHKGLRDASLTAKAICSDVGSWAADWFIYSVVEQAKTSITAVDNFITADASYSEKAYLKSILDNVVLSPVSYSDDDILDESSDKVRVLVECLLSEKAASEERNESYSGLIFVERRESVLALAQVLIHHPQCREVFRVGSLLGAAGTAYKHSALDITRKYVKNQDDALDDFRRGEKNLIVSTAVAEEGIDVQACGSVIRWDPPPNMPSWAQSRGRARRKRSTFTLMFNQEESRQKVRDWEQIESQMMALVNDDSRNIKVAEDEEDVCDDNELEFRVEATGALLTLNSAVSHLNHFCALIPHSGHVEHKPLYDIDPPDLPEGWHSDRSVKIEPYRGPYGARLQLPRLLPNHIRIFETDRVHPNKPSAYRHTAFDAYKALYTHGLLNDHLLPLTSFMQPELDEEVKALLKEVERRAGTAQVSMQMDPWASTLESTNFFASEIVIGDLPPLLMFTRVKPIEWAENEGPTLYRPGRQDTVTWRPLALEPDSKTIAEAANYTRRLFWYINGTRMDWDDLNFSYLFLPTNSAEESAWVSRRLWHCRTYPARPPFFTNALDFGTEFSFPKNIAIIRKGPNFAKAFKFVRWRYRPLSMDEEMELRDMYPKEEDLEITYPLLVVQHLPPRTNFLLPIPEKSQSPTTAPKNIHLLPEFSYVTLCSQVEAQYSFLLPSVLRAMEMSITINSMRQTLFSDIALYSVPEQLLMNAMCAPISQEKSNYQRLETLGDTCLKFMASLQLLGEYPLWHEGYLTKKMGHSVSNVRLAKENIRHSLYQWIIRDRLIGKKWKPKYLLAEQQLEKVLAPQNEIGEEEENEKKNKKANKQQDLSTKVLADVVESLIGAVYLHGGFDYAFMCAKFFDMGIKWEPLPRRIQSMLNRVETNFDLPIHQLETVESMLGYTFDRKLLLVEALTHASYQEDLGTISYERLEFCGDAVLDMIMTEYLYRAPGKEYSPGHMHLRKSAMVNAHTLAYFCLATHIEVPAPMPGPLSDAPSWGNRRRGSRPIEIRENMQTIHLWQCLMHSSPRVMDDQRVTFERFTARREEIEAAFTSGAIFPWATLVRLQAPKFFSDMIESLVGAVFLDSEGDLEVVRGVLKKLGMFALLERIVASDMEVLHPVSQLSIWAGQHELKLGWDYEETPKVISCAVKLSGEILEESRVVDEYRGKSTKTEVRFAAAEKALLHFRVRNFDYTQVKPKKNPRKRKHTGSS
ncbi:hypothetical protein R3P38DRAFT_2520860 [Favolaschia claudopus]|uniref:P-loop containing nucleoside triphosphate hydrolase protein n=1 Tax=Favolaschia claudopus TaxID=2862362 RepID=A0AAW0C2S2_9AGAR